MKRGNWKLKFVVVFFVITISLFGGLVFYISTKISPDELKKITIQVLKKTFKNTSIELGVLDYSIGTSLTINVNHLKLNLLGKHKKKDLVFVKEITVNVSLWTIITGGGTLDVNVNDSQAFFYTYTSKENNWTTALGNPKKEIETATTKERKKRVDTGNTPNSFANSNTKKTKVLKAKEDKKIEMVEFFKNCRIDVKFNKMNLVYRLNDETNGQIFLPRILIKDLNLKTTTAFELASKINFRIKNKHEVNFDCLIIGDLNVNDILSHKDLKSSSMITLSNIYISSIDKKLPSIKSDLNVSFRRKDGAIFLKLITDLSSLGNFKGNVSFINGKSHLKIIESSFSLKTIKDIFAPYNRQVKANLAQLALKGTVDMDKKSINPKVEVQVTPAMSIKLDKSVDVQTTVKGNISNDNIDVFFYNSLLKGQADLHLMTQFNLNRPIVNKSWPHPIQADLSIQDLNIPRDLIQRYLYLEEEKIGQGRTISSVSLTNKAPLLLPTVMLNVIWNRIKIDNEIFSGNSTLFSRKHELGSEKTKFHFSKGKGNLSFLVKFMKNNGTNVKWTFLLSELNLDSLRPFLPPKRLENVIGTFTGRVDGTTSFWSNTKKLNYNINFDLKALNGKIKGVRIEEMIAKIVDHLPLIRDIQDVRKLKVSNSFDKLVCKGNLKNTQYLLKKFEFLGIDKNIDIKGKGILFPPPYNKQHGNLTFRLKDNTGHLSSKLKKMTNTTTLPIKIKAEGFDLKPDYQYTLKKMSKLYIKKQLNKPIKGRNKIKKLLKGLL